MVEAYLKIIRQASIELLLLSLFKYNIKYNIN